MEPNLILTGFMGVGKTTVGRLVANRLGRAFVDLDEWIAARAGKPVAAIFSEDGEERFRAWEAEACRAWSQPLGTVIATGGWTLGTDTNRQAMRTGGRVICLSADPGTILARLDGTLDRPLLAGHDPAAAIRDLLARREPVYHAFAWQIDTTRLDAAQAADRVLDVWRAACAIDDPESMHLSMCAPAAAHEGGTRIVVGTGLAHHIGAILRARGLRGRAVLVSDSHVGPLHRQRVMDSLAQSGFECLPLDVPAGEASKSLAMAERLYAGMAAAGIERGDLILALGGGVVGDLAGFVAATYLRGLRWVCLPTSLLAMVDASVGGKVGVDLAAGKNLVGAFHPPLLTLVDLDWLDTLPHVERRAGLAEVIKAGMIGDVQLFEMLEAQRFDWREIVLRALGVKVDVVRADPFEAGRRAVLNLGHSVGHALEAASSFALRHGEAVAIGLAAESRIAEQLGLAPAGIAGRVESLLSRSGLPTRYRGLDPASVQAMMRADKKRRKGRVKFALPRAIGEAEVGVDVADDVVWDILREVREAD